MQSYLRGLEVKTATEFLFGCRHSSAHNKYLHHRVLLNKIIRIRAQGIMLCSPGQPGALTGCASVRALPFQPDRVPGIAWLPCSALRDVPPRKSCTYTLVGS